MNRFFKFGKRSAFDHLNAPVPVLLHSEFGKAPNYARRRIITVLVFVFMLGGAAYAVWGPSNPPDPADIPTIKAEGEYKQKPDDPGGIDIPHQDMRVYDQLESKPEATTVEHLLPPPEAPQEPSPAEATGAPVVMVPPQLPKADVLQAAPPAKPVSTTVEKAQPVAVSPVPVLPVAPAPAVAAAPAASEPVKAVEPLKVETPLPEKAAEKAPAKGSFASGNSVVQLASSSNEKQARALMETLQKKYADTFGDVKLHLSRADLGSKGIFYRIQSDPLAKDDASRLCASLKKLNAGCIVVGR